MKRRHLVIPRGRCPTCGKFRYSTRQDARVAARELHAGELLTPYRCGRWWHIGHVPKSKRRRRRKR